MLETLVDIRGRKEDFGLHCLLSGGTILAANKCVKDRVLKRHDRWKLKNVKDGYIERII